MNLALNRPGVAPNRMPRARILLSPSLRPATRIRVINASSDPCGKESPHSHGFSSPVVAASSLFNGFGSEPEPAPLVNTGSTADISVLSLKGQRLERLVANILTMMVGELKAQISRSMPGQRVQGMKLIHRAKYLADEGKTLAEVGIKPGPVQLHLVSRLTGGGGGYTTSDAVLEISRQLKSVTRAQLPNVELIDPHDEWTWSVLLRGPADSPYANGLFSLNLTFPFSYPYAPPNVVFKTPIFHPNVNVNGRLCWSEGDSNGSQFQASVLISAVTALLEEPNASSPENREAASLYQSDRAAFLARARSETAQYALH